MGKKLTTLDNYTVFGCFQVILLILSSAKYKWNTNFVKHDRMQIYIPYLLSFTLISIIYKVTYQHETK